MNKLANERLIKAWSGVLKNLPEEVVVKSMTNPQLSENSIELLIKLEKFFRLCDWLLTPDCRNPYLDGDISDLHLEMKNNPNAGFYLFEETMKSLHKDGVLSVDLEVGNS